MTDPEFKLSKDEVHSAIWAKIKAHLEQRLDEYRRKNDGNLPPDATAKLRGRIASLKDVLGIGDPDLPAIVADNDE